MFHPAPIKLWNGKGARSEDGRLSGSIVWQRFEHESHNSEKQLIEINKRALYVPCAVHTMNLLLANGSKSSTTAVSFFGTITKVYTIFMGIYQHVINLLFLKPIDYMRHTRV